MTNPTEISYGQYCSQLLDSMVSNVIYDIVSTQLLNEKLLRKEYGTTTQPKLSATVPSQEPDLGRFAIKLNGRDIYVNAMEDNSKMLGERAGMIKTGTAQDTYFKCTNCDRKIAGSRFAAHIDKCLGGRSRK